VGESIAYNFKLRMTEKSSQMDGDTVSSWLQYDGVMLCVSLPAYTPVYDKALQYSLHNAACHSVNGQY